MNWKQAAMEDLDNYERRRQAVRNLEERIEVLQKKFESARGAHFAEVHVKGNAQNGEEAMVENIAERERLRENLAATKRMVELVERGLAGLATEEREVLKRFYLDKGHAKAQRASMEMHVDRATVYRMRDEALKKFTVAMFGVVEL